MTVSEETGQWSEHLVRGVDTHKRTHTVVVVDEAGRKLGQPDDEHEGRDDTIRAARNNGMRDADEQRRTWHRIHRNQP